MAGLLGRWSVCGTSVTGQCSVAAHLHHRRLVLHHHGARLNQPACRGHAEYVHDETACHGFNGETERDPGRSGSAASASEGRQWLALFYATCRCGATGPDGAGMRSCKSAPSGCGERLRTISAVLVANHQMRDINNDHRSESSLVSLAYCGHRCCPPLPTMTTSSSSSSLPGKST